MKRLLLPAIAVVALISVAAFAQSGPGMMMQKGQMNHGPMQGGMHGGMQHGQSGTAHQHKGDRSTSSLAFAAANQKMHEDMAITFSGDADVDFVRGMIPHHQGAIDMAKIVLAFGKNAEIRKLAEDVIKAQEGEIALMRDWLKKNGK